MGGCQRVQRALLLADYVEIGSGHEAYFLRPSIVSKR